MNQRPGVFYALTDDGIALPIVDVTHPAFACSDARQAELTEEFVKRDTPLSRLLFRLPKRVRRAIMRRIFAGSRLGAENCVVVSSLSFNPSTF